jgi:catechol 2,3-dioxygenase-like lactoylglutathione lyase family enzyme
MFTHVMIGSNDLERARRFYDATFAALGGKAGELDARGRLIYLHEGGRLMITKPINGNPATAANGGTIGISDDADGLFSRSAPETASDRRNDIGAPARPVRPRLHLQLDARLPGFRPRDRHGSYVYSAPRRVLRV